MLSKWVKCYFTNPPRILEASEFLNQNMGQHDTHTGYKFHSSQHLSGCDKTNSNLNKLQPSIKEINQMFHRIHCDNWRACRYLIALALQDSICLLKFSQVPSYHLYALFFFKHTNISFQSKLQLPGLINLAVKFAITWLWNKIHSFNISKILQN